MLWLGMVMGAVCMLLLVFIRRVLLRDVRTMQSQCSRKKTNYAAWQQTRDFLYYDGAVETPAGTKMNKGDVG